VHLLAQTGFGHKPLEWNDQSQNPFDQGMANVKAAVSIGSSGIRAWTLGIHTGMV
jgi:hypothetical protein